MPDELPQLEVGQLLAEIEASFGSVRLGEGISLHQAEALDYYETPDVVKAARLQDTEERWQDISDDKVDEFNTVLPFMDAAGFRFHMPLHDLGSYTCRGRVRSNRGRRGHLRVCAHG